MNLYKTFRPQEAGNIDDMKLQGDYRLIKKDGRTGWNGLKLQSAVELYGHNLNENEGSVSIWFLSLEELCTTLKYNNFQEHNKFYYNYPIITDHKEKNDFKNAVFCINWDCGWYPQLCAKFFRGEIYPDGYAPTPKAIVTAGHCSFDKEEWYQLVFTWNKSENRYRIYINGVLIACSDIYTAGMEWEEAGSILYLGNPTLCISDITMYRDEITDTEVRELFDRECSVIHKGVQDELLQIYAGGGDMQPFCWQPGEGWRIELETPLKEEKDLDLFYVQGAVDSVHMTRDGLLIDTPDHLPKHANRAIDLDQMYLWTKKSFEGDLYVEFQFKSLRQGGLSLLMFQGSGMQREDFMQEYPLRTNGSMSTVHSEDVRNYHWEYYREMNDTRNDTASQVLLKNPWFRPLGYHCLKEPITRDEWHTLKLLQEGEKITCVIDNMVVLDLKDDGFGNNGPVLSAGHIAVRCMVRTKMLFKNLKVMNKPHFKVLCKSIQEA